MNAANEIWNEKSKTYASFDGNLSIFQKEFFKILDEFGVEFNDKTLVDIGCGSGVYTLYLARFCKNILAIDVSDKMLEKLNSSALEFNIKNIQTLHLGFDDFKSKSKFDIAFLTMSPSLKTKNDFERFLRLGDLRIYMNWKAKRESSLLKDFLSSSTLKLTVNELENYLKANSIPYKSHNFSEDRVVQRSVENAVQNILWHAKTNDINLNENTILTKLKELCPDEIIKDRLQTQMRLLVF